MVVAPELLPSKRLDPELATTTLAPLEMMVPPVLMMWADPGFK